MTYRHYYAAPDEDVETWSVYYEDYASILDDAPLPGTRRKDSTYVTEHAARMVAVWAHADLRGGYLPTHSTEAG